MTRFLALEICLVTFLKMVTWLWIMQRKVNGLPTHTITRTELYHTGINCSKHKRCCTTGESSEKYNLSNYYSQTYRKSKSINARFLYYQKKKSPTIYPNVYPQKVTSKTVYNTVEVILNIVIIICTMSILAIQLDNSWKNYHGLLLGIPVARTRANFHEVGHILEVIQLRKRSANTNASSVTHTLSTHGGTLSGHKPFWCWGRKRLPFFSVKNWRRKVYQGDRLFLWENWQKYHLNKTQDGQKYQNYEKYPWPETKENFHNWRQLGHPPIILSHHTVFS